MRMVIDDMMRDHDQLTISVYRRIFEVMSQFLDGSHVLREVSLLITQEVVIFNVVGEGKPSELASLQQVVKDLRLAPVKVVIDYTETHVLEVRRT